MVVTIQADGSWCPQTTREAYYGFAVFKNGVRVDSVVGKVDEEYDARVIGAELIAVYEAVSYINNRMEKVVIESDCEDVVKAFHDNKDFSDKKYSSIVEQGKERIEKLNCEVSVEWISRDHNHTADELVTQFHKKRKDELL